MTYSHSVNIIHIGTFLSHWNQVINMYIIETIHVLNFKCPYENKYNSFRNPWFFYLIKNFNEFSFLHYNGQLLQVLEKSYLYLCLFDILISLIDTFSMLYQVTLWYECLCQGVTNALTPCRGVTHTCISTAGISLNHSWSH